MTYEIINGWIVGKLRGTGRRAYPGQALPSETLRSTAAEQPVAVPAHDRDARLRGESPLPKRVPGRRGRHRSTPAAVGERLGGGRTRPRSPPDRDRRVLEARSMATRNRRASSPLVALMALLHRRGFVATALSVPIGGRSGSINLRRPSTRTTDATRSGTTRSCTVMSRSPATSIGIRVRSTIRRCFRWSATFWLRGRSMARCLPTISSRGSSSRTGCVGTWIAPTTSPRSPDRTARDSGSRGGSRRISKGNHRRPSSNPGDPRPKACTCHPMRSTPDRGGAGAAGQRTRRVRGSRSRTV